MKRLARRKGATLGLVAVIVLFILMLGVAFFLLSKFLGGGREIANATDAGVLNVAKWAIKKPSKDALTFANQDVGTNFALLGEAPRDLNLITYNRCVAQSAIVALNAKEEGTVTAANNAVKVWTALNDVGSFLRKSHESSATMGQYFNNMANSNNIKMLGQKGINLNNYSVSFMHRGSSTNVYVNPALAATFAANPSIPTNIAGAASTKGFKYMVGYSPFTVTLPATGNSLSFSGVPVAPQDRPHLVKLGDFQRDTSDNFVAGSGTPAYPADTLPVNSFQSAGETREAQTSGLAGAVACAIVGSLDREYEASIPYGYIVVRNGPSAPGPKPGSARAMENNDIFAYELAHAGIVATDSPGWFCNDPARTQTLGANLINQWADWNGANNAYQNFHSQNPPPPVPGPPDPGPTPDVGKSLETIRRSDGSSLGGINDLKQINKHCSYSCKWSMYDNPMNGDERCLQQLPAFKAGYGRTGSSDNQHINQNSLFTNMEQLKIDVLTDRNGAETCRSVPAQSTPSGCKWFNHSLAYPTPSSGDYNFGLVKKPIDYLKMIDEVSGKCGQTTTFNLILKRCQQIVPAASAANLMSLLSGPDLPLGGSLYIFASGNSLTISPTQPNWVVPGTVADGRGNSCGNPYPALGNYVDAAFDGNFQIQPFGRSTMGECQDAAIWTPSTGYNNMLGELLFNNTCTGGDFCRPN